MQWDNELYAFEVWKQGYMKRFVFCDSADDAVLLGRLVSEAGARLTRIMATRHRTDFHYYLPDDTAVATLELIAYYTGEHSEGMHLLGRLSPQRK